ncbi:Transmembrane protein 205 [Linum perenne]
MTNALSIFLVLLTALLASDVWSPPHPIPLVGSTAMEEEVIVKGGHRSVAAENFDDHGGSHHNTKVSISPPTDDHAVGANHVSDKAYDLSNGAKRAVGRAASHVRDKASNLAHDAKDTVGRAANEASGKASEAVNKAKDKVSKATHQSTGKASKLAHQTKHATDSARQQADDALDKGKEATKDTFPNTRHSKHTKGTIMDTITGVLNLLGLATAYGTSVWMTFISTHVLGATLPRHQFGIVQSKVYPVYFKAMALSTALALFSHLVGRLRRAFTFDDIVQALNLVTTVVVVGVNGLYLEPMASKAMMERMKVEKEEGKGGGAWQMGDVGEAARGGVELTEMEKETRLKVGRLNGKVRRMNKCSSGLNMLSLMGLTWHLVYLGRRLHFFSH